MQALGSSPLGTSPTSQIGRYEVLILSNVFGFSDIIKKEVYTNHLTFLLFIHITLHLMHLWIPIVRLQPSC